MAHVNYRTARVDDAHHDIICESCGHAIRVTRDELRQWLMGGYDASAHLLSDRCPACDAPYEDHSPGPAITALENEFVRFGTTVAEVMTHFGSEDEFDLDANIGFVLLGKEERLGLGSFSLPERHVYAVQAMNREVNNGGFDQFFGNDSWRLALDLAPALEAMGLHGLRSIADRAVGEFGQCFLASDADRERRLAELAENDWAASFDEAFYDSQESIEARTLEYIQRNLSDFD